MIFVCAHGAGGHKDDAGMLALDRTLSGIGLEVVRFNFPYREKGSKRPDPMPVLKASIAERGANATARATRSAAAIAWNMQWLEGADHSLKRVGDLEAIARETRSWLATL